MTEFKERGFDILFLGTGASTGVPEIGHVLRKTCQLCMDANNHIVSKNRRNNVSVAVLFKSNDLTVIEGKEEMTQTQRCVIVDAGKTMRDAVLRHLCTNNIDQVDGLILTHGHADAIFGMDDIRDLQKFQRVDLPSGEIGCRVVSGALPIYLHKETMDVVKESFSYLVGEPEYYDTLFDGHKVLKRRVALLGFNVIDYNENLNIHGMTIRTFPVFHGGTYISLGFAIGHPSSELVYISDVKIIPDETWTYLISLGKYIGSRHSL